MPPKVPASLLAEVDIPEGHSRIAQPKIVQIALLPLAQGEKHTYILYYPCPRLCPASKSPNNVLGILVFRVCSPVAINFGRIQQRLAQEFPDKLLERFTVTPVYAGPSQQAWRKLSGNTSCNPLQDHQCPCARSISIAGIPVGMSQLTWTWQVVQESALQGFVPGTLRSKALVRLLVVCRRVCQELPHHLWSALQDHPQHRHAR